jgi:predicted ATPase
MRAAFRCRSRRDVSIAIATPSFLCTLSPEMRCGLDQLSISGFRSIRKLADPPLDLRKLNVLVGANGAGKSNFVTFFRMLRAMSDEGLAAFVLKHGKADSFLFNGLNPTKEISAHLVFGENEYRFRMEATATNELMIASEETKWKQGGGWRNWGGGRLESKLKRWENQPSIWGYKKSVEAHVYDAISSWVVYHFHDTSTDSLVRRDQVLRDWNELQPDARNLAAFLFRLKETNAHVVDRIRETVQLIAPYFDDFFLEPDGEQIRLQWRQ